MDGFDRETVSCVRMRPALPEPASAVRLRAARARRSRTSRWRSSTSRRPDVHLEFRRQQFHLAPVSRSPRQASSAVELSSAAVWGCDGGPKDTIVTLTQQRARTAAASRRASTNQTLARRTRRTPASRGVITRRRSNGDGGNLERVSGDRPHPLRSRLENRRHHAADAILQRRQERQASGGELGDADLRATPITPPATRTTGRTWVASLVNAIGESAVLEFDRDLHHVGRLRRLVRSRRRRRWPITTGSASACRCWSSRHMPSKVTSRTFSTSTAAF